MGEARIALVHGGSCSCPCRSHAAGSVGRWPSVVSALRTILLGASSRVRGSAAECGECGSRTRPPGRAAGPPTRRRRRRLVAVRGAAQPACRPCLLVHVRLRLLSPAVLGSLACSGESDGRWGAPRDSRGAPVSLSFRRVKLWCHSAARAP